MDRPRTSTRAGASDSSRPLAFDALPDVAAGSRIGRFAVGVRFAIQSIAYTCRHRRLLRAALIPMVIQLVLIVVIAGFAFHWLAGQVDRIAPISGTASRWLHALVWAVLGLLAIVVSTLVTFFAASVVCDPFYDALSEATEVILLGRSVGGAHGLAAVFAGIVRELWATVLRLAVYAAGLAALLVVGLVPGVALLGAPLSVGWTWLFIAIEVFARPQARYAIAGRARFGAVRQHTALALGFGAGGWLIAMVPFTAPFLVVGGTRLYLALAAHDRVPSALTPEDKAHLRAGRKDGETGD